MTEWREIILTSHHSPEIHVILFMMSHSNSSFLVRPSRARQDPIQSDMANAMQDNPLPTLLTPFPTPSLVLTDIPEPKTSAPSPSPLHKTSRLTQRSPVCPFLPLLSHPPSSALPADTP
jgi:hypothetical protein